MPFYALKQQESPCGIFQNSATFSTSSNQLQPLPFKCLIKPTLKSFVIELFLEFKVGATKHLQWCPLKRGVSHHHESCPSYPHPPLSYEGRREQKRELSF